MQEEISKTGILFKVADSNVYFEDAKNLFIEYANSLDVDLCFQNFEDELKNIQEQYGKPKGALIIAYKNNIAIGCAGIRQFDENTAELKRMFVRDEYRSLKIGKRLLEQAIDIASNLAYKKIRLDTLPGMTKAQALYRSFGFQDISAYRHNPVSGTVYMEKELT